MLKWMRDQFRNLKIVLWFVVFVFVLLIFVDWGTGRAGSRGMTGLAAKMGSIEVTEAQFLAEMRTLDGRLRQMYGEQYEQMREQMDVASMAIQNLVDRQIVVRQAQDMGLEVSDKELLDAIVGIQAFQRQDGSFVGEELYARILRSNNTAPDEFEASLRQDILLQKYQQAMEAGVVVSDAEVRQEYAKRNENVSLALVYVPVDRVLDEVTVTEADARAYYDANQDDFSHGEQRQLRYLLVDDLKLRRAASVPEPQIEEYYASHRDEFARPEEVKARHILVKPDGDGSGDWSAAEREAEEVYRLAAAPGADFAALARQHSDDTGSRDSGGDLGWFPRGRMVKEFEDAAFALATGQISRPVRSQFGYHVIRVEDHRAAGQRPLAEVRDAIQTRLAEGTADAEGSRRAAALREKVSAVKASDEAAWQALADEVVTSNLTPFFESDADFIPGVGRDPGLLEEVRKADAGDVGGPHRTSRGWIVYRVAEVRKAGVTPFAEARAEAEQAAKREKAAQRLAEGFARRRAAGLEAVAAAYEVEPREVTGHTRGSSIPGVGVSQEFETAAFAAAEGTLTEPVVIGDRGVAIARVQAKKAVDPALFERDKASLAQSMVQERVQTLLAAMILEHRREHPLNVNPDVIERFKPRQG